MSLSIVEASVPHVKDLHKAFGIEGLMELMSISDRILEEFPPSEYLVISLGNASTVLDSFLRAAAAQNSDLQYLYEVPFNNLLELQEKPQFIDQIIPPSSLLKGRKIVFLRSLLEGQTMNKVLPLILTKASEKLPQTEISLYFLHPNIYTLRKMEKKIDKSDVGGLKEVVYSDVAAAMSIRSEADGFYSNPFEEFHRFMPINLKLTYKPIKFQSNSKYHLLDRIIRVIVETRSYNPLKLQTGQCGMVLF